MSVRTWPEATEGRNPLMLASRGQCCQQPTAQSAVTRLQLSAARVHAPTDSHSLDTELTAVAMLTIPGLTGTIWALATKVWAGSYLFIALADAPGQEGKGILVMDWRNSLCPLIASIVPGTRATYWGRVIASSYLGSPKEMKDCKVDGFMELSTHLLMLTPISSLVARESASASEMEWQS